MARLSDSRARIDRRARNKFESKRTELAQATLHTLAELGFARTSLREIAQNSEYSHGLLHYYFADKLDLITLAVQQYEAMYKSRYDEVLVGAAEANQLLADFIETYLGTLASGALMHRLWYDLRNQSLFVEPLRAGVLEIEKRREDMIWRVLSRYGELRAVAPTIDPASAYVLVDGIFQRTLLHQLAGNDDAIGYARTQLANAFVIMTVE
ncbi:TetR/AcrR family transcriptional regulator [Rhodococcoides fascians]|uniref:TetR/AcrR family transcriptional regulator n=1 Tax=Rhodococcoides fascians TaxID=1828 RepID=UPI0005658368|nr:MULTISPECIES: TetR/AcrR family transcriptional regulator [Rhodococcus]OZF01305.1 TetR/AcrR family transcriptional regulator [Rhodococcus sp. 15-1189-1-1a]OZF15476.1 TetR/AcrR family transcriptional regulator [Rhodococcus sp. 14-2686-1-2]